MTNETVATGWVIYADEGPYTIDIHHVEEMVGTTREAAGGDRVRRGRDRQFRGRVRRQDGGDRLGTIEDESPYTIDVHHVEEMVETTREASDGDRVLR